MKFERPTNQFKIAAHPIARTCARLMLLAGMLAPIAACSTLDSINPFGGEKYETKLLPDIPAQDIYDQG